MLRDSLPTKKLSYSLTLFSGLMLILCQPPVSLFFLAYLALVPLFFALREGEGGHNFLMGFATGIVCYLGLVYWVVVAMNGYGGISVPFSVLTLLLLVLYMALFTGLFTWLVSYLKNRFLIPYYLSAPPVWIVLEYVRTVFLTGFPWSFLAHSQYNFLPIVQVVSVTGTYFLSFLIVAVNVLVYQWLAERRFPRAFGAGVVALVAACLVFGFARMSAPIDGRTVKASIVQGNIRQDVKFDEAYKNATISKYIDLTFAHSGDANLIVWPETAMPFIFLEDRASTVIRRVPVMLSRDLLLGTISRDGRGWFYNTAYVIGKRGEMAGTYSKTHLVPFGEYTPLVSLFPFLGNISAATGDFRPGPSNDPITTDAGRLGMLICYEGVFPRLTAETVRRGAEVLVNITNDAWFGPTSAPYQHYAFYIFRAVETDRYLLRAANTGFSAIIDPRGRTMAKTGIFKEAVLNGEYKLRQGKTFYVRHGDYFVLLSFLFICAIVVVKAVSMRSGRTVGQRASR